MPTIIDSLVVTLGLDPKNFTEGQKKAIADLKKTEAEAARTGKSMRASGEQAAMFFSKVRNEALGLFAVLLGGKGLAEFTKDAVTGLSALGRAAHNIGMNVADLAAFRNMIQASGGSADAATASFQSLTDAMETLRETGNSPILPGLRILSTVDPSITAASSALDVFNAFTKYADAHKSNPQEVNLEGHRLGLDQGSINEAMKGSAQVAKDLADAYKRGVPDEKMTKDMQALQRAFAGVEQAAENLGNKMLDKLAPGLTKVLDAITKFIEDHPDAASATGVAATVGGTALGALGLKSFLRWLGIGGGAAGAGAGSGAAAAGSTGILGTIGTALAPLAAALWSAYEITHISPTNEDEAEFLRKNGHPPAGKRVAKIDGNARAKQAYDYFTSQGWDPMHAAALAGNINGESGFDETQTGDGGLAVGIGQWHPDRVAAILKGTGIDVRTAAYADQLRAMQWELTHTEKAAGDKLRATHTMGGATGSLAGDYERSANPTLDGMKRAWWGSGYLSKYGLPPAPYLSQPGGPGAFMAPSAGSSATHNELHVGQITIHSKATDASGIARDIGQSLQEFGFALQANQGMS